MTTNYDDIINLPHHVSKKHPQMPMIARAAQFGEAVGALTLVGDEPVAEAAGADDDAVICTEFVAQRFLFLGAEHDVLGSTVVVAGGLEMAHALRDIGLDLTEAPGTADNAREMAGQGVERHVEGEATGIVAVEVSLARTRGED